MRHEVLSGRPTPQGATASADGTNFAARVAMEQASTLGWDRYVGDDGAVVGMHTFGASAPLKQLLVKFGFTPDQVAQVARDRVAAVGQG
jgi:transketolase